MRILAQVFEGNFLQFELRLTRSCVFQIWYKNGVIICMDSELIPHYLVYGKYRDILRNAL